jgi:hypothetical protein
VTEVTSEPRVYMRHVRAAKLCSRGCREWFKAHPELDYNDFLSNGIPVTTLEELHDAIADQAIAAWREEAGNDGR